MRFSKSILAAAVLLASAALIACGNGSGSGQASVADTMAAALGGGAAILAVETQQISASGQWFEPEQTVQPGDPPRPVSDFQYTLTDNLAGDSFRYDWVRNVAYPFVDNIAYSEVIAGSQGFVDGKDTAGGVAGASAMLSSRIATLAKFHRLASPLHLVRTALTDPQVVIVRPAEAFNGKQHQVLELPGTASPVRLFIDPVTSLPAKAETLEDDPYYGDTLYEVIYEDWRQAGTIMVPFLLTLRLQGLGDNVVTLATEVRSAVQNGVTVQAGTLDIPAELQAAFDPADALRGERMSQWFLRRQAIGLPGYVDQTLPVTFTESSPGSGIWHVAGGSHNSLVVDMADHLIVVEPPLYESRSQAVIAETKTRFPGKPIRTVVVTHFHNDHGGGVRAYAAEGATVVVGAASQAHIQAILAEPHTLVPDALQNNPQAVTVQAVPPVAPLNFTDGVRSVDVYPVLDPHAADMVIAHVPGEDLVFVSDLFSPPDTNPVALATLPQSLQDAFTTFGINVDMIAGGHGAMAEVQ